MERGLTHRPLNYKVTRGRKSYTLMELKSHEAHDTQRIVIQELARLLAAVQSSQQPRAPPVTAQQGSTCEIFVPSPGVSSRKEEVAAPVSSAPNTGLAHHEPNK